MSDNLPTDEQVSAYFRKVGAKGKKNRWASMTKEQRSAHGRMMNDAKKKNKSLDSKVKGE